MNYKRKLHVSTIFKNKITAESVKLAHHRKGTLIKFNTLPPYNKNDKIAITSKKKQRQKNLEKKNCFALILFVLLLLFLPLLSLKNAYNKKGLCYKS